MLQDKKQNQSLYDPSTEHDSCGVGFIAALNKQANHKVIEMGLTALSNLTHRGAVGGDANTGDGAGLLFQIPHEFFISSVKQIKGLSIGEYGVGQIFFPDNKNTISKCKNIIEKVINNEGLQVLTWREVPTDDSMLGEIAKNSQPYVMQVFIKKNNKDLTEQKLYILRRVIENTINKELSDCSEDFYICSLSTDTINYKGMLLAHQLPEYYPDLNNSLLKSRLVIFHQRYSTNTFPSWKLAQPFRYAAHNGEINTLRGNINKMHAREKTISSPTFGKDIKKLFPITVPGGSDSGMFDNTFELLVQAGRSLEHSLMMMIPEAFGKKYYMSEDRRAFYEYYSSVMEPWDGPAALVATDGKVICGTLDRNGLRPARYIVTKDDYIILASEIGVIDVNPENIKHLGRLQPGKMLSVNTETGRISFDNEVKSKIVRSKPYRRWLEKNRIELRGLFHPPEPQHPNYKKLLCKQHLFGYDLEEMKMILVPMAVNGQEPIGAMGIDIPIAVLSDRPQLFFNYFKQLFAQVTNPPIDPYKESLVMSLMTWIGKKRNILEESPEHCSQLKLSHPILSLQDLERIKSAKNEDLKVTFLSYCFDANMTGKDLEKVIDDLCITASKKVKEGYTIIVLTDRDYSQNKVPMPSLLALSAVHHYLIRTAERKSVGLIVETGEARAVMHYSLLIGYGANAIVPYLAFQTLTDLKEKKAIPDEVELEDAIDNYINAIKKGLLKTLSRMGISTLRSYQGAQIFEAIGISEKIINKHFFGTVSRISGIDYDIIVKEAKMRHSKAFPLLDELSYDDPSYDVIKDRYYDPLKPLEYAGNFHYRKNGERHLWNPTTISKLQDSVRRNNYQTFKEYSKIINEQEKSLFTLRGMFKFKNVASIPIEEVEPVENIFKRFVTGAMSFGSISKEAHESLAIAMNKIGGASNSGEGGEDPIRFKPYPNGDNACSAIKQIASGRFGVSINYLANAKELQIKIAQGAKPGEGGQLPGHKVNEAIAKVRNSTPGVTLISPPPHHDIYSIEDIAQLIFDLKNSNLDARISVKLVSEVGVATVAAGVAKAKADMILISGYDGGTGASPITSIYHAGLPWELGLAETQQVLVENKLRDKVRLQVDGNMKSGRDIVIGAILGAEEFGFATAPLVSMGCCLLRKCHLNTCTMGIATQDPDMRKLFEGKPEHVINFFTFIAQEAREYMASIGIKSIDQLIGRTDLLEVNPNIVHWKANSIDFSRILYNNPDKPITVRCTKKQDHNLNTSLDNNMLIDLAKESIENKKKIKKELSIKNIHRTVGTMLSGIIAKKYGAQGLPDDTIHFKFNGNAGQSFGAFLAKGVTLELEGFANDYLGKGLSGGKIIVYPPKKSNILSNDNVIVGNTLLYGAIDGEVFIRGAAGERFGVRNSGVTAVVEGLGDHGCEYMTGGTVLVLGKTGRNFAAGMSGGIAYVWDENQLFDTFCNLDMVDLLSIVDEEDKQILKKLISKHYKLTGSRIANRILETWEDSLGRFVKVFPIDYRKALERLKQQELANTVTMDVTEEVYGD
ncbi:MAG: glutamate synthase large subunit [Spirochaetes bacterium]|nr:glutamate synthase large subunit [Spirochaetota bacterium]